jgi:type IV pilus assembly protein PilA
MVTNYKQGDVFEMTKKNQKGFSLIELLIVVAIILIIAAIAIPNLLRSRIAANEASAVGSIRTINTAEVTYSTTYPDCGFTELTYLGGSGGTASGAGLVDSVLASGVKSGYSFGTTSTGGSGTCGTGSLPNTTYSVTGDPSSPQTGQRHFFSDQSGVIRYDSSTNATSGSNPLQ